MEIIKGFLQEPILYLILAGVFLCVVLPWLKKKAKETPTVLDDRIWTLVEMWLAAIVQKLFRRGMVLVLFILPAVLSGCMFTGYGVNYDSGVWLRITTETDGKKVIVETTLNESDLGTVEAITQSVMDSVK